MSVVDAIGWVAALCSALLALPQGYRIAATRSVSGVSLLAWQTMLVAGIAWCAHGLLTARAQLIWPNALLAVTSAGVLWQLWRARRLTFGWVWGLPAAATAVAFGADVVAGPVAFAAVILVPDIAGALAQLVAIRRTDDVLAVSSAGLLLNLLNQVLWLIFAIPIREISVICVTIPMSALIIGTLVALRAKRRASAAVRVVAPMTAQRQSPVGAIDLVNIRRAGLLLKVRTLRTPVRPAPDRLVPVPVWRAAPAAPADPTAPAGTTAVQRHELLAADPG